MTRKRARIGLAIIFVLWLGAEQRTGRRPADFYYEPITAFLVYFGPPIALVLLVLSFVGRKGTTRKQRDSEQDHEGGQNGASGQRTEGPSRGDSG